MSDCTHQPGCPHCDSLDKKKQIERIKNILDEGVDSCFFISVKLKKEENQAEVDLLWGGNPLDLSKAISDVMKLNPKARMIILGAILEEARQISLDDVKKMMTRTKEENPIFKRPKGEA